MILGYTGQILQILALAASFSATAFYIYSYVTNKDSFNRYGNYLFTASSIFIISASIILFTALAVSDFDIQYVAYYSDTSLPLLYKLSAFWGAQEGSLLLWTLLIMVFGSIEMYRNQNENTPYKNILMSAISFTAVFFIILICFQQNPFVLTPQYYTILDGNGLNPLLQNPGMALHPPALYIGFVGYTVVFAHAFASIVTKDLSSKWILLARPWSMVIWAFLTIGIVIGGWWAYIELGWGGYWYWDPVENASLMPWLTATAFLHSAYIYEKRNSFKLWVYMFILATFELTILGTFITRSGVVKSVHSFAPNAIGTFFLVFIIITSIIFLFFLIKNRPEKITPSNNNKSLISREDLFFAGNLILSAITIAVLAGTIAPLITKKAVEIGYFNSATIPFFTALFLVSGLGLLTGFKITVLKSYYKNIFISLLLAFIATIVMYISGYRKLVSLILAFSVYFSLAAALVRTIEAFFKGGIKTFIYSNRFLGAMIAHIGVSVIAFGIVFSSFYKYTEDYIINPESEIHYKNYKFFVGEYKTVPENNYITNFVEIKIYHKDKFLANVYPEIRLYNSNDKENFAEVAYISRFTGDIYFALRDYSEKDNAIYLLFSDEPFVSFIWFGTLIMALGAIYGGFNFARKKENKEVKSFLQKE